MSISRFVYGGGSVTVKTVRKPKTHRLLVWTVALFVISSVALSGYAITLLLTEPSSASSIPTILIYSTAGIPPSILGIVTLFFAIFERSTENVPTQIPNPNYDPHNLY